MAMPTSTNEVTVRRIASLISRVWDKMKLIFLDKSGGTMTGRLVMTNPISQVLIGTGVAATSSGSPAVYYPARWKFNLGISSPTAGDRVYIRTPVAGHDYGVFVSLDNGTTYYPVARNTGKSRLTTQYPNGSYVCLVFEDPLSGNTNCGCVDSCFPPSGATARQNYTSGCWRVVGSFDSGNTVCQLRHEAGRFYAGSTGCNPYSLVCLDKSNKFSMLVSSGSGTGTSKTINTAGKFRLSPVILYYNANNTAAANARVSSTYQTFNAYQQFDTRYSHNHTTTFTVDSPLYIECTIDEDGFWSPTAKCITQTFESGKYYIFLGMTYSTEYQAVLMPYHPLYYYDGANLTEVPRLSKADREKLDGALQSESDPVFSASPAAEITYNDISNWNGKYAKPSGGIPKSDLASEVQNSLGKADTALQTHQDITTKLNIEHYDFHPDSTSTIKNWNALTRNAVVNIERSRDVGVNGSPESGNMNALTLLCDSYLSQMAFGNNIYYRERLSSGNFNDWRNVVTSNSIKKIVKDTVIGTDADTLYVLI